MSKPPPEPISLDAASDPARVPDRPSSRVLSWLSRIGHHELGLLVGVAIVAGGAWVFAQLGGEVLQGGTGNFDAWLLRAMRNPNDVTDPIGPRWFEESVRDVTALGSITIVSLLTLVALGFLFLERKFRSVALVATAVGGGAILSSLLKSGYGRARPDIIPHAVEIYSASFPSGHSMLSAVVYLTVGALLGRVHGRGSVKAYLFIIASLLTLIVGVSRVYLGVHYPTDVLAGWCAGATWAALCWVIARWLQRHGDLETGAQPATPSDAGLNEA